MQENDVVSSNWLTVFSNWYKLPSLGAMQTRLMLMSRAEYLRFFAHAP